MCGEFFLSVEVVVLGRVAKFYRRYQSITDFLRPMEIPLHAAHTGFFLVLSLFPALLLFLGLLRYIGFETADLIDLLEGILPGYLLPLVERLVKISYRHSSGTVVSVSVLATLWSASKGTHGLLWGLNAVYGVDVRPYWRSRSISMIYTFLFLIALVLTLAVHIFGSSLLDFLWMTTNPLFMWILNRIDLQFLLLLLLQIGLFSAMYALLPGQRHSLRRSFPGAVLASLGWSIYSRLFSVYVEHFTDYTNIFGSIYALALGMLWLYFCICILLYGAAFNRLLSETPPQAS